MEASRRTLVMEIVVAGGFLLLAVLGYRRDFWLVVAALIGHGVFDFIHHFFIDNPGVPHCWPGFCLAFDALLGASLAVRLTLSETLFRNPEEMNADVSPNRLRDEQQISGQDKCSAPSTRWLRMDMIWASSQKMVIQAE
jgi:hypothetical protein